MLLAESVTTRTELKAVREQLGKLPQASGSAPILVALGNLDHREGDTAGAEKHFQQALALDPNSSSANYFLGNLFLSKNDLPHAGQFLAAAAKLAPPRSLYRLSYAELKLQTGDPKEGSQLLEKITQDTPDFLPAWLTLAEIAANENKYDESLALVAKVLALDSNHPQALILSARMRLAKGEKDEALTELLRMEKNYPKYSPLYYQMGRVYLASGDIVNAVLSLNQAVTLAPSFTEAIVLLAEANVKKGDFKTAAASMEQVVVKHPELPRARLLLADAYAGGGEFDKALAVYAKLEQMDPKNPEPYALAGRILLRQNKRTDARQSLNTAIALAPGYLAAIEQLTGLDIMENHVADASNRLAAEIQTNPKSADLQNPSGQGVCGPKRLRRGAEARLVEGDRTSQPDSPTAYFMLAEIYIGKGEEEKAMANLREVVAKDPEVYRGVDGFGYGLSATEKLPPPPAMPTKNCWRSVRTSALP